MKAVLTALLILPCAASAATAKKKSTINFEDELIEGTVKQPDLLHVLQKKQANFPRLIKLRPNFLTEMRATAATVRPKD
jgi:hypothetical protein